MPTISDSPSKKKKKKSGAVSTGVDGKKLFKEYFLIALSGGLLGLSAPGINQWYIAWFGAVPLLIAIATSSGIKQAFLRGFTFGTAYNLVYISWLLGLQPLNWLGFNWWQGGLLASAAWIICSVHQGLITALFATIARLLPITGGFFPKKTSGTFSLPALLAVPLLWILVHNFIGNAHDALGIPWTMIEYSQYKQAYLIQCASIIGGVGIGFLLIMWNTALATLLITFWKKKCSKILNVASHEHAFYDALCTVITITAFVAGGFYVQSQNEVPATLNASVLQGNINIDMQKTEHRYTLPELWQHYTGLVRNANPGLCVWTEGALPAYLCLEPTIQSDLKRLAKHQSLDLVVGSIDRDALGHPYNSAYGITSDGSILTDVYHKRYLVPYGEYTPWLVNYLPEWIKRLTNTPAGGGYTAGRVPVVLRFKSGVVAPLVCFETLSPELVASSVRAGGQLLVNISDLAWFHGSIIGDQMNAFSVMRAVESRRYFIFAANTGPSVIINPSGHMQKISPLNKADLLLGKTGLNSKVTPFDRWFVF